MIGLSIEMPPFGTPAEEADYFVRQWTKINDSLLSAQQFVPQFTEPAKPQIGDTYNFAQAIPPDIAAPGLWIYTENGWERLLYTAEALRTFVQAGYGGILKSTDTLYGPIADGGWTTVDNWDVGAVTSPEGITQDVANSGLHFDRAGAWSISITLAISFIEAQAGRVIAVRLYNVTTATGGNGVDFFVGRNQDGVNITVPGLLAEILAGEVGNLYQIQIAGVGDAFANTSVLGGIFSANQVSEAFAIEAAP